MQGLSGKNISTLPWTRMNAQTPHGRADGFTARPYCAALQDEAHLPACYPRRGPDLVCCLSSCLTPACKSSPLAMAGSLWGVFFRFPWQMTDSMYDGTLACGLPTVNRLPCGVCVCGRPWTMNTGHIFSRSAFYRCSQKSHYLQGHVAHPMCLKK